MLCRALAAALVLLLLGGFVLAETYSGLIIELSDSKLTIRVRKEGEKKLRQKVLEVVGKVTILQPKGKAEKPLTFSELQNRVARAKKNVGARGVLASVSTNDGGKVVTIKLAASRVPEQAAAILEKADQIELYSLEPEPDARTAKDPKVNRFHDWVVLGKTVLKNARTRKQALDALDESVGTGLKAKCFDPRHGIRASHGGKTVDVVICFECGHVYFYFDPGKEDHTKGSIGKGTQPVLDAILKAANVPLAKVKKK
jgi:hypothetical protein